MEPRRNLFTIGQASEYLGVSIDTLRRWEKKGRVEAFRSPGGHRYYERDDLDKLFGKKYVHMETHAKKDERQEAPNDNEPIAIVESPPPAPIVIVEESTPYIPPIPQRTITIPEMAPIQIAKRIETEEPPAPATIQSSHPIISSPPISQDRSFLMPQLSPLKEPMRDETILAQSKNKGKTKETMQVIVIISILVLVIVLAIILAVMMLKSSQSILSPSP
jgi:excisionase family DNA binding protein